MPRYRLKPGHKHYHLGQKYEGRPIGKPGSEKSEFPDVLELDEDRAERIANKLILLDDKSVEAPEVEEVGKPEEKGPETESTVLAGTEDSEQASEKVEKDSDSPPESEVPEKSTSSEEDSSPLFLKYIGNSKWNVMKGDKPINDAPLTEEEAKALVEGSKE